MSLPANEGFKGLETVLSQLVVLHAGEFHHHGDHLLQMLTWRQKARQLNPPKKVSKFPFVSERSITEALDRTNSMAPLSADGSQTLDVRSSH